mgnify:CR=1 FL=1
MYPCVTTSGYIYHHIHKLVSILYAKSSKSPISYLQYDTYFFNPMPTGLAKYVDVLFLIITEFKIFVRVDKKTIDREFSHS